MPISMAPSAIIEINTDLTDQVLGVLVTQLFINQVMTGAVFDGYVAANQFYPEDIHNMNWRILVLRDLNDYTNRNLMDLVLFAKAGLVTILYNRFGPPTESLPIAKVYLSALINLNTRPHFEFKRRHKPVLDNDLIHPHGGLSILRDEFEDDEEEGDV